MDKNIITDLEEKVGRAIELIAGLKENNKKIEKENESLKHRLEDLRIKFDKYKKDVEKKIEEASAPDSDFDSAEVKRRLSKLVGKLAAFEDSWI